jgi:DNA-binding MarR family transcriptional regulator
MPKEPFDERTIVEEFSLAAPRAESAATPVTRADRRLFEALMALLRSKQDAAEHLDEQVASVLGVHRTAARCVEILLHEGSLSAGELAERAGVSKSGTTPLLDRLEDAGIIHRRRPADDDRRRVTIELTEVGRAVAQQFWDELFERLARLAQSYTREELDVVQDFLERANVILNGGEPSVRTTLQGREPPPDDSVPPYPAGSRPPTLGGVRRAALRKRSGTTLGT